MSDQDQEVEAEITKTSAIASWSGFVYQGKVAIYQAIRSLIDDSNSSRYLLKVEHLDDFAIFDENEIAKSIHQVKANQSPYRSSYSSALTQAANINAYNCNKNTKRYFHVSVKIDDFSDHTEIGTKVCFYEYHTENCFVAPDEINTLIKEKINEFLLSKGLHSTPQLVDYKLGKLNSLVADRINYAHAINQKSKLTQYESADSNPIYFEEILSCLFEEVINLSDKVHLLEIFRSKFIEVIDEFLKHIESKMEAIAENVLIDFTCCRKLIAGLDLNLLEKLYYSLDPKRSAVEPSGSGSGFFSYLNIIYELPTFFVSQNIPHYISREFGKYIPSSLELRGVSKNVALNKIIENVESIRMNSALLEVLFEFDNLIVDINKSEFNLIEPFISQGKITHNGESMEGFNSQSADYKIMKAKSIRFVSIGKAKGELLD